MAESRSQVAVACEGGTVAIRIQRSVYRVSPKIRELTFALCLIKVASGKTRDEWGSDASTDIGRNSGSKVIAEAARLVGFYAPDSKDTKTQLLRGSKTGLSNAFSVEKKMGDLKSEGFGVSDLVC